MSSYSKFVLLLSCIIIVIECALLFYFHVAVIDWVSHHLWVVVLPFAKTIIKHILALKFTTFLKALGVLFWHCIKLVVIKLLKTIGLRYGLFFSQYRWRFVRRCKLVFLRKGKQFFRSTSRFWQQYTAYQQWLILLAFFPIAITVFLLGLSFTITRKTMIQKTQEAAMVQVAANAGEKTRSLKATVERIDRKIVTKIKQTRPPAD